jgi:hypothetical protein
MGHFELNVQTAKLSPGPLTRRTTFFTEDLRMQEEQENERAVDRRRLLRRAGTVAAGLGAAGVATAVSATPASAADGEAVLVGGAYTGTTTTLGSSATTAPLKLTNDVGPQLQLGPLSPASFPATEPAPGSVIVDTWGDVTTVGQGNPELPAYYNPLYSPTWASMVVPVSPMRWLVTLPNWSGPFGGGRDHVVSGSATYDSAGRVLPKNSTTTPDLKLSFSDLLELNTFAAVQGNLTIASAVAPGWAALWDDGSWPQNSSINFQTGISIANFTQTLLSPAMTLNIKLQKAAVVIFDITGFVLADPYTQFTGGAAAAGLKSSVTRRAAPRRH